MYENLPDELKSLPQWVTANKGDKAPRQTGMELFASATAPQTWCSFTRALQSVEEGERDYIGFCFHDNGIVGIDLDEGFEDGWLSDTAIDILKHCQSYTEISKSGRGLHIFVKGNIPFKGRNNGNGVEMYKDERYFITTGNKLIYSEIVCNQDALDYIVERYFPEVKRAGGNCNPRLYNPVYKRADGKIKIRPDYPIVPEGGRHTAMLSLAGQLWSGGASEEDLRTELLQANDVACDPPLPVRELDRLIKSVVKYERRI